MKASGFGLVPLAYHPSAVYADPLSDNLYLVLDSNDEPTDLLLPVASTAPTPDGATIYQFNGDDTSKMGYRWKSKLYLMSHPASFFMAQVRADQFTNTVLRLYRQVWAPVDSVWQDILVREVVVESEDPIKFPVGNDYTRCWWELISTDQVQGVQIVEDVLELT